MAASKFGPTITALVTLFGTTSLGTDAVFDGWPLTSDVPVDYLIVGGTEDPDDDSGEIDTDWAGLGAKARDETAEITCAILAGTGDDTIATARARALSLYFEAEALLRADPSLGGVLTSGWCHITKAVVKPVRTGAGVYVRVRFTVAYQSRI